MEDFIEGYISCALWCGVTNTDGDSDSFDDDSSLTEKARAALTKDAMDFYEANHETWAGTGLTDSRAGHDFWLSRNGHGAGFWDEGLGPIGDKLHKATKPYGEAGLYTDDDEMIHHD